MRGFAKGFILAIIASVSFVTPAQALTVHTVTFEENLPSGNSQIAYQTSSTTATLTPVTSLVPTFVYPGRAFLSWNTQASGNGTKYLNGAQYSFGSDLTLYAQWQAPSEAVTFHENRTLSDTTYASETRSGPSNLTLFVNLTPSFSNPGYGFVGWNTEPSGKGTSYLDGAKYSFTTNISLYAQWVKVIAATTPLVLVGVVSHGQDHSTIQRLATSIRSKHFRRIEVVQVGKPKSEATSATKVASTLAQMILQHGGPEVTVVVRHVGNVGSLSFAEVFAS
jgi:hypothetical protein